MINYQIISLLIAVTFFSACNGQAKTNLLKENADELKPSLSIQTKLVKRQGAGTAGNVHCGLQDKAGNLWFGTTGEGVYRYNGSSFTNLTTKDGLSSDIIWSLWEDKAGNIWFGTDSGICRYDGKTISRIPVTVSHGNYGNAMTAKQSPAVKNSVWSIMQDKVGTIWFGTSEGVYCYNGTSFTRFLENQNIVNDSGLRLKMVQCMLEDKAGNVWFGSGLGEKEGLCRFDGRYLTSFKPNGDDWVRSIFEDKNGTLWVACRHKGLSRFDGKTFTVVGEKKGFDTTGTGSIVEDKTGNIWFASLGAREDGGVWRFNGKTFTNFNTKDGLTNNSVFCIVADRAGNIWFGTGNMGLCRYDGKSFTRFSE
ncbi:ligand-binding sensor domain-containing protein [Flavisolibacter nicotianae]|uniref:ligand-binding sensor domain-containing protein n=1 Tax=Flavisolibacter nicotianae TaxID=2364882 RepID=UPI000EAD6274|nr:two-component regulator propeller domain-containing protein [Flavisolibacter nicotianae]